MVQTMEMSDEEKLQMYLECQKEELASMLIHREKVRQPFCCPVCGGNGIVPNGFYSHTGNEWTTSSATPDKCKSCDGTGVVWGQM